MRKYLLSALLLCLMLYLSSDIVVGFPPQHFSMETDPETVGFYDEIYIHGSDRMPEHVKNYLHRFIKTARNESLQYGIPTSIKLAQAMLESSYGRSTLAVNGKNHFGIKSRNWKGPIAGLVDGHVYLHDDCDGRCRFQRFKSDWASWRAHSLILQSGRYDSLKGVTDYREYARGLQRCGYATSDSYAKDLISIINRYELHLYDCEMC